MTDREQRELQRLEENMHRLIFLVQKQSDEIVALREELASRTVALDETVRMLQEAEQRSSTANIAGALAGSIEGRDQAAEYLAEIIKEVECCIGQLRAE